MEEKGRKKRRERVKIKGRIEERRKGREERREKEGRKGGRTELEGGRREKKDRIGEIYRAPCLLLTF